MLQRISHDQWTLIIAILAFAVTATVFFFVSYRAIRLSKKHRDHLANLPLEDEKKPEPEPSSQEPHV